MTEFLGTLQSLATLFATGAGTYIAWSGVNAWKREVTGRRDLELCQRVIEKFYEAEENIQRLRSVLSYPTLESKDRERDPDETTEQTNARDTAYVPLARYNQQSEFWADFFSTRLSMRALFGNDTTKEYQTIGTCLNEFRSAAITLYRSAYRGEELRVELHRRLEAKIWEEENDPISAKMNQAVRNMEDICLPIVRSHGNRHRIAKLWEKLNRRISS